jgi:hypothetical protein
MILPKALVRLAKRVAALAGVEQEQVESVLLGGSAEPDAVKRIAEALRHLRDEPDALLLCGLEPVVCTKARGRAPRATSRVAVAR